MFDVCERIRALRTEIVEQFKVELDARGLLRELPEALLLDDVDQLIDRFCHALEGRAPSEGPALSHAHTRWESGANLYTAIREYGLLTISIISVLAAEGHALAPHEQIALVNTMNRACAMTMQQYVSVRDDEYAAQYASLRRSEAIRDALLAHAPIGVALFDHDVRFRFVNEHLARLAGLPREGHIGRTPSEVLPEALASIVTAQARETISSGQARRHELVTEVPAMPDELRAWVGHWYPVRLDDEVIGVGVLVEETTERKRAAVFRERLIGVVSHDLRNPLSSILMSATLVLKEPNVSERIASLAQRSASSARRMTAIVEQLYDYVSIDQGKGLPLTTSHVDLAALAQRVIDEIKLALPNSAVMVDVEGDVHGDWDEARIAQVLSNLVGNAVQHGEGTVAVALHGNDTVRVDVRNRGAIPQEKLRTIFEPFKTDGEKGHLGLGLFIASEIVRAHGGTMHASSDGQTTTFTFELPRVHAHRLVA